MGGGYYHAETESFVGPILLKEIESLSGRIAFFGANGFDLKSGITSYFIEQAEIVKRMMEICQMNVAVIESSKFKKVNIHRICDLSNPIELLLIMVCQNQRSMSLNSTNIPIVIV